MGTLSEFTAGFTYTATHLLRHVAVRMNSLTLADDAPTSLPLLATTLLLGAGLLGMGLRRPRGTALD